MKYSPIVESALPSPLWSKLRSLQQKIKQKMTDQEWFYFSVVFSVMLCVSLIVVNIVNFVTFRSHITAPRDYRRLICKHKLGILPNTRAYTTKITVKTTLKSGCSLPAIFCSIEDNAEDGKSGMVWLLCSFYDEPLCSWMKTNFNTLFLEAVRLWDQANRLWELIWS